MRPRDPGLAPRGHFRLTTVDLLPSVGFADWLAERGVAVALTVGDGVLLVGRDEQGDVCVSQHPFDAAAGIASAGPASLRLVSDWQLWRLDDALADGERDAAGRDRLFLPQSAHTTGFLGSYDVAVDSAGAAYVTSAICNCVATPSSRLSFTAVWRPPFVSGLDGGDRCHVTGLVLRDDALAYVTCAAATDESGGWTAGVRDGGVVVDASSGETVASGLSLPHSPRMWGDRLLVAEGGRGRLLAVDPWDGSRAVVAQLPGLTRGLAVVGDHAVVGCSRVPAGSSYGDAPVAARDDLIHALAVVDLRRGTVVEQLELRGSSGEVIALTVLGRTRSPGLAGPPGGTVESIAVA